MTEDKIYIFKSDEESGYTFTKGVAVVAFVLAPLYLYVFENVVNLYFLAGFAVFAALTPFAMRKLRLFFGGIEDLAISEESIELIKKKSSEKILWSDIREVEFERVNDMPWVTLITNEGDEHRILLEDFKEGDREQIHFLISGQKPDKTEDKTTWIIANRLSFSSLNEK